MYLLMFIGGRREELSVGQADSPRRIVCHPSYVGEIATL